MATYTEKPFAEAPFYSRVGLAPFVFRSATRVYANADVVKYAKIERDQKVLWAAIAFNDEVDSDASPTATAQLELTDGTTTRSLVTVTAAQLGTANGFVQPINVPAALGYVIPSRGFWLQLRFTAAFATAATGIVSVNALFTNVLFGSESVIGPTG